MYCFGHLVKHIPEKQRRTVGDAWYQACRCALLDVPLPDGSVVCERISQVSLVPFRAFEKANEKLRELYPDNESLEEELEFFKKAWTNVVDLATSVRKPPPPPPKPPNPRFIKKAVPPKVKKPVGRPRKNPRSNRFQYRK
jgi:hypothetical protein